MGLKRTKKEKYIGQCQQCQKMFTFKLKDDTGWFEKELNGIYQLNHTEEFKNRVAKQLNKIPRYCSKRCKEKSEEFLRVPSYGAFGMGFNATSAKPRKKKP